VITRPEGREATARLGGVGFPGARSRVIGATVPLGELALVTAGTPGYQAAAVAEGLRERGEEAQWPAAEEPALPFVVTSSIDPYRLRLGPVRYQRRRWHAPELRLGVLTPGKRALFERPKVLVAGVSRRLEAARDATGVALGVGVYAIVPRALPFEPLLALLNSASLAEWYRHRFLGRELSGGYFAVNAAHLAAIPVPRAWVEGRGELERVVALVRAREACDGGAGGAALEAELERIVAALL
jgi:hypothetical protein